MGLAASCFGIFHNQHNVSFHLWWIIHQIHWSLPGKALVSPEAMSTCFHNKRRKFKLCIVEIRSAASVVHLKDVLGNHFLNFTKTKFILTCLGLSIAFPSATKTTTTSPNMTLFCKILHRRTLCFSSFSSSTLGRGSRFKMDWKIEGTYSVYKKLLLLHVGWQCINWKLPQQSEICLLGNERELALVKLR